MSSLFLGKIETKNSKCEIHALTKSLPFREYSISEISDESLYRKILEKRYSILEYGHPIYCTAINPNKEKKIETNPHDEREGTVHIVALDSNGGILSGMSVAVDIGGKDNNKDIGLPLENKWKRNGYPLGSSLDDFRKKYIRLNYSQDRDIKPWEMAELYRHFNVSSRNSGVVFRIGLYTGCYRLLTCEPRQKNLTPTTLWGFDAIPQYFYLYRMVGCILRDFTINKPLKFISPSKKSLLRKRENNRSVVYYKDVKISRNIATIIPSKNRNGNEFLKEEIPFVDGLVDVTKLEKILDSYSKTLFSFKFEGVNLTELLKMRSLIGIIMENEININSFLKNPFSSILVQNARRQLGIIKYEFD